MERQCRDEEVLTFLDKYYPDADRTNCQVIDGYGAAQTLTEVLEYAATI
jgi:hypothetical protein